VRCVLWGFFYQQKNSDLTNSARSPRMGCL
jgi:hypothetical protein